MAEQNHGRIANTRRQTTYRNSTYVQGTAVRQLEELDGEDVRRRRVRPNVRRKHDSAQRMNFGYVLFLSVALVAVGMILIGYIKLQSNITTSMKHVSSLEAELNDLKKSNDEAYTKIESSVDLNKIKQIAINELGMTYASKGQVVEYSGEGSDYVRQVGEIPKSK